MIKDYIKKTLSNGVKLYLYLDNNMKQSYCGYMIGYGSSGKFNKFYYNDKLYTTPSGCAHFLEHLLGEHSKYGNIYHYFASQNYIKNGVTGEDYTAYFFRGTKDIKNSIKKLINTIDDPVFNEKDIEECKKAIVEETKRGENNHFNSLYNLVNRNLYKDLDLADESLINIGSAETNANMDYETLKLCYDAYYYDANKTLLIAGPYEEKEIIDFVEEVYKEIPRHKCNIKSYEYNELDKVKTAKDIKYKPINSIYAGIGFKESSKGFSKKEISEYNQIILDTLFSSIAEESIRLKKENILKQVIGAYTYFLPNDLYHLGLITNIYNENIILEEIIKTLKSFKMSEEDFALYVKDKIASEALSMDFKYDKFIEFKSKMNIYDHFNDIEFYKHISYERLIEYYNSLKFDNNTLALFKGEK